MQVAQIKDGTLEIIAPVPYLHLDLHLSPIRHLCHDVKVSAFAVLPRGGELAIGVLEPREARASIREHQGIDEVQEQMFPVLSSKEKLEKTIIKTIDTPTLVSRYLTNQLIGHELLLPRIAAFNLSDYEIHKIYKSHGIDCRKVPMDECGVSVSRLNEEDVDVLHICIL